MSDHPLAMDMEGIVQRCWSLVEDALDRVQATDDLDEQQSLLLIAQNLAMTAGVHELARRLVERTKDHPAMAEIQVRHDAQVDQMMAAVSEMLDSGS